MTSLHQFTRLDPLRVMGEGWETLTLLNPEFSQGVMAGQFFSAARYLTRMPASAQEIRPLPDGASVWFPAVGLAFGVGIGLVVRAAVVIDIWFAALLGLIAWTVLTRARPLAGLAAYASETAARAGAEEGEPKPAAIGLHVATIAVALLLITQLILLMLLTVRMDNTEWVTLALLLGWARLAPMVWVNTAARTREGDAALLWPADRSMTARWALALFVASLLWDYSLLAAPLAILLWQFWLRRSREGITIPGVLAGIAVVEGATLAMVIVRGMLSPFGME